MNIHLKRAFMFTFPIPFYREHLSPAWQLPECYGGWKPRAGPGPGHAAGCYFPPSELLLPPPGHWGSGCGHLRILCSCWCLHCLEDTRSHPDPRCLLLPEDRMLINFCITQVSIDVEIYHQMLLVNKNTVQKGCDSCDTHLHSPVVDVTGRGRVGGCVVSRLLHMFLRLHSLARRILKPQQSFMNILHKKTWCNARFVSNLKSNHHFLDLLQVREHTSTKYSFDLNTNKAWFTLVQISC